MAQSCLIARRGLLFILSSPSGAGKTTTSRRLLELDDNLTMSVSATTRPPRPGEKEGYDYRFVDDAAFDRMLERGQFLEHAEVFGHRYGTPSGPVEAALDEGRDVLFDIDWQGTQQLAQGDRGDVVSTFILPPSTASLRRRLEARAQDSPEVVAVRMAKASEEMSHWHEYDYIVVNEDVERTVAEVLAILGAERLRRDRQTGLKDFVDGLRVPRRS